MRRVLWSRSTHARLKSWEATSISRPPPTARLAVHKALTRNLLAVLFVLAAAACLAGQFAVVREVLAGRAPGVSNRRAVRWAEIAWVLIPAAALVAVLIATWMRIVTASEATSLGVPS